MASASRAVARLRQVLVLDPPTELRFRGPFTRAVTARLELRNPSERTVCFKVKSTAPGRYCVRPRCGVLAPGAAVTVAAALLPCSRPGQPGKHKLMVQTMFAPADTSDLQAVWREARPGELMDSKLTCLFEIPKDNDPPDEKPGGVSGASSRGLGTRPLPALLLVIGAIFVGFFLGKFIL